MSKWRKGGISEWAHSSCAGAGGQSQGILYTFQTETVLYTKGEYFFREKIVNLKEAFGKSLDNIYGERDAGVLKAVLLGDKSSLREQDELLYQKNGIFLFLL